MEKLTEDVMQIIKEQEQEMYSKLHSIGNYVFNIFNMASKLEEKFPRQIRFNYYPASFTIKGKNYTCSVERQLSEYVSIKYEGECYFTFKEQIQEDGTYKVQVYDVDDTVTASSLYECVVGVYNDLRELIRTADTRIRKIETELESM